MAARKAVKTPSAKPAAKKAPPVEQEVQPVTGGTPVQAPYAPASLEDSVVARRQLLDAIANSFNSENHIVVARADQAPNPYIVRRPTGITELDVHLGGGFPAGGLCFISGEDNTGKTWLLFQVLAMQQKIYGDNFTAAMAISEGGFPYDQALRVGFRIAVPDSMIMQWNQVRLQRGMPGYSAQDVEYFKTQIGDFRIIRGSNGEEVLTAVLRFVETHACSVICIDSLQGLQPIVDAGKELTENEKMMAHANMLGRFYKRYIPLTTGLNGVNETTLLGTQQARSNKAKADAPAHIQKYLKDWAIGGAYSTRHYKLVDLVLHDGSKEKQNGEVISKDIHWELEKGKAGTHDNLHGSVKYSYRIPGGVDFVGTVVDSAIQRNLLRKVGNRYTLVRPGTEEVLEQYTAPSLKAFRRGMDLDFSFEMSVRLEVLASAGISCLYR